MSLLDELPHKCRIQRRSRPVTDAFGGAREIVTVVSSDVPCWEQGVSAREMMVSGKPGVTVTTKVYFATDPGILDNDEIVITERNGVEVTSTAERRLQALTASAPDASAGAGELWRVLGTYSPGYYS